MAPPVGGVDTTQRQAQWGSAGPAGAPDQTAVSNGVGNTQRHRSEST